MNSVKKVLFVVTNCDKIDANHPTGLWLEEFALPYYESNQNGFEIVVASPLGGKIPIDPNSIPDGIPELWQSALKALSNTVILSTVNYQQFDALILPGGHGPMFDLAQDVILAKILRYFALENKIIGAVCHGPAALVSATLLNGQSIVANRKVTGFTNEEEVMVKLDKLVPFLLEDKLKELGANYVSSQAWSEHVIIDGNIITGQNPQSSGKFAKAVADALNNSR